MNPSSQRLAVGRPRPLRVPSIEEEALNIDEPIDSRSMQRLYAVLERQRQSQDMGFHFRTSRITDIVSNNVDSFLADALFAAAAAPLRHRRAETSFCGRPNFKQGKSQVGLGRDSEDLSSAEGPQKVVPRVEGRQRVMANLQSYLTKSYENYRQNFYATTERQRPPALAPAAAPLYQPPVITPSLNLSKLLFPATFAKQASQRKEEAACTFIDFNSSAPTVIESPPELRDHARACRFFKITVSASHAKETKPSVSTQSSGNSHFACN